MAEADYGLKIVNTSGEIQIDGSYINLMYYELGSETMDTPWQQVVPITTPFLMSGSIPLAFHQVDSTDGGMSTIMGVKNDGTDWTGVQFAHDAPGDFTQNMVVYRNLNLLEVPEFGLAIKNADNEIVFTN